MDNHGQPPTSFENEINSKQLENDLRYKIIKIERVDGWTRLRTIALQIENELN